MLTAPASKELISELFDNQPDGVAWYTPVFDDINEELIKDFKIAYCNRAAAKTLNATPEDLLGVLLLSNPFMSEIFKRQAFQQCLAAWQSGKPVDYNYYSVEADRYFNVQRTRVSDGILTILRDRSKEVKHELLLQEQENDFKAILDTSVDGTLVLKSIRNAEGEIIDFMLTYANKAGFEKGMLPPDSVGRTIFQVLPDLLEGGLSWHKQVVETGIPASYETSFVTPQGDTYGWFIVSLTKLGDGLISRFIDISQRKADEKKIQEQNLLLESIFHASLNAIITCEAVRDSSGSVVDLKFLHVNDMFKRMVLSDEKDVLGRNMLELFPRTQTSGVFEKHCEVLDTGVPARFEIHYDGERLSAWFEVSSVKLDNNRIVISFANITNAKTAALQIESQKLLLDNILKHSLSGIAVYKAIKDEQGIVQDFQCILANEATENLTGIPNSLRLSTTMCELVPSLRNSPNFEKAVLALQEGQPFQTSMYYEPVQKWMDLSVARMDSDHLINVFVDISTIKRAQVELEHSLVELKRSHESLEEFTRNASHDLKEPIRKVQFFLDRLRQSLGNRLSEEEQKIYSRLENANTRMGTLVDDLLEYSHVNQQSLKSEAVDLNTVLKLVLADLEAMIQDKRGKVIVTELLPVINGDRIQLQQLFFNLVNNSLKYSQSGLPPQVVISSQKLKGAESGFDLTPDSDFKDFYLVQIIDNGIGFEQEHAHHIFNVFTRLHGNSEYSGTGVGLAIVRKVVENHNGFIKAEGTPGKGAMFSILLPT